MRKSIAVIAGLLLLSGCNYDFPKVDSGVVRRIEGAKSESRELTILQVSEFVDWCAKHRDGWAVDFGDYFPRTVITFRKAGIDVVSAKFVGSKIVIRGKSRVLTIEESKTLQDIFGIGGANQEGSTRSLQTTTGLEVQ